MCSDMALMLARRRVNSASMDPFAVIMLGGVAVVFVGLLLLGRFYPGSGAEQIDWFPTRAPELEIQNEEDDLRQMLDAANYRRRQRGEPELTEDEIHMRIAEDRHKRRELQDKLAAENAATNAAS